MVSPTDDIRHGRAKQKRMNKKIVVVGFIIVGGGVANAWFFSPGKAITPVILGGYILVLLLSLLDVFGGQVSVLAGAIAILACTFVVVNTYLPLLGRIGGIVGGGNTTNPSYPSNQH